MATPANAITVARLLATPALIVIVAVGGPAGPFRVGRGHGPPTFSTAGSPAGRAPPLSGAFLDPLADKVAVMGILAAIAGRGFIPWLPVVLIAAGDCP